VKDFELFSKSEEGFVFEAVKDDFELFSETEEKFVFETVKKNPGWFLIGIGFLITLVTPSFAFLQGLFYSGNIAYSVGQAIMPLIFSGAVVLCFQIGKSFRNNKSRLKIYFWTMVVGLFSSFIQFIRMISALG
jgi:hypothetical protein